MKEETIRNKQEMPKATADLLRQVQKTMHLTPTDPECLSEILKRSKGAYSIRLSKSPRTYEG